MNHTKDNNLLQNSVNFLVICGILGLILFISEIIINVYVHAQGCYELNARKIDFVIFSFHFLIVAILLYLAFRKFRKDWLIKTPLLLGSFVFIVPAFKPGIRAISKDNYEIQFDQEIWKEKRDIRMIRQLINSKSIIGNSREEVQIVLGKGKEYTIDSKSLFYYPNGKEIGLNLTYLQVEFSNDTVSRLN